MGAVFGNQPDCRHGVVRGVCMEQPQRTIGWVRHGSALWRHRHFHDAFCRLAGGTETIADQAYRQCPILAEGAPVARDFVHSVYPVSFRIRLGRTSRADHVVFTGDRRCFRFLRTGDPTISTASALESNSARNFRRSNSLPVRSDDLYCGPSHCLFV